MKNYQKILPMVKNKKLAAVLLFITFVLVFFYIFSKIQRGQELKVIFLDIGQGDSTLIKFPEGQNMLIDTGPNYLTNQKLEKELSFFNEKIDLLLLTHPDLDHVGGTEEILNTGKVKMLIESSESSYSTKYFNYNTDVSYVNTKNYFSFDYLNILNINPKPDMYGEDNHKSIVNVLKYGNFNFIFTGDADSETERGLVFEGFFDENKKISKSVNILKVGHHGSDTSSSEVFLKKLKPEYCVISVGESNKYGHPNKNALERLKKYCKNIYRTDIDGSISFKTEGKHLTVESAKK